MDATKTQAFVDKHFQEKFVDTLSGFIKIPNCTPAFDADYLTNGHIQTAIKYILDFTDSLKIPGLTHSVYDDESRPPMVCIVYPGEVKQNVMIYGHLDKQPFMEGRWSEGLDALTPVIRDNKLYGRGSADDGYSVLAALLSIQAAREQGVPLPRICILLETEEESGSENLLYLMEQAQVKEALGKPDICICLDSETADYDKIWVTSSLRGLAACNLKIEVMESGQHSGLAGGIVPETFTIARQLLDRLEDSTTGVVVDEFNSQPDDKKRNEAKEVAEYHGSSLFTNFKLLEGVSAMSEHDLAQMYLQNVWYASLSVTGGCGLPDVSDAGNVLRPWTQLRVGIRLPPNVNGHDAAKKLEEVLTKDPPYGCKISVTGLQGGNGFCTKPFPIYLNDSIRDASMAFFGQAHSSFGIGGSIPFLSELGQKYPEAQIIPMGAMGPDCNAHNPDESIDLPYAKKFVCFLSHLLGDIGTQYA
eukprot:CFRG7648T1